MCYNKEVSFVLSLFGVLCAVKEFKKGTLIETFKGVFIICLVLMQLNEFFLHLFKDPRQWSHQIFAFLIPITLTLQAISVLVAGNLIPNMNKDISITITVLSIIYLIGSIFFLFKILVPMLIKKEFKSTLLCKEGCRLKWDATDACKKYSIVLSNIMFFCYMIPLFIIIYFLFGLELMLILLGLLVLAYFLSFGGKKENYNKYGSMWCLLTIVVFSAVIIVE